MWKYENFKSENIQVDCESEYFMSKSHFVTFEPNGSLMQVILWLTIESKNEKKPTFVINEKKSQVIKKSFYFSKYYQ